MYLLKKDFGKSVHWFSRYGLPNAHFDASTLDLSAVPGAVFMDQKTFFFVHAPCFDALYRFCGSKSKKIFFWFLPKIFDFFKNFLEIFGMSRFAVSLSIHPASFKKIGW